MDRIRTVAGLHSQSKELAEMLRAASRTYDVAGEGLRVAVKHALLMSHESTTFATNGADFAAGRSHDIATHLATTADRLDELCARLRVLLHDTDVELPQ